MDVSYEPVTFDEVSLSSIIYNTSLIIDKNAPLNHSTLFTTEYSIHVANYGEVSESNENSAKNNLQELIDSGYATKLSESTAKEYFEKSHFKYYSGVSGNLLLVYYPERGTSQTYILP